MQLSDLEPRFLKLEGEGWRCTAIMQDADGVQFQCPKCYAEKGGAAGRHFVICWRPHVPREVAPGPGRWDFRGSSARDLSLVAGSSSVRLRSGCQAHFFVEAGAIRMV